MTHARLFLASASLALAVSSASAAIELRLDSKSSTASVSRELYGMNVARWDFDLYPTTGPEKLKKRDDDAIQKLADCRPAFLKYPGGNDADSYVWNSADNLPKDMDTDEFIDFCRRTNAPAFLTVNFTSPTLLAADWLRHFKAVAPDVKVPYWEVGDEVWGWWAKSHTSGAGYAKKFQEFSAALKQVDPSVSLAANLSLNSAESSWTKEALEHLGTDYAIVTTTFFPLTSGKEKDDDLMKSADQFRALHRKLETAVVRYRGARPKFCCVGFNSVNTHPGPQSVSPINAVYMAQMFGAMADVGVDMACWWAFRNAWPPRGGDYGILSSDGKNLPHYHYYVYQLLSNNFHGNGFVSARSGHVEAYGVRHEAKGSTTWTLMLINPSPKAVSEKVSIDFSAAAPAAQTPLLANVSCVDASTTWSQSKRGMISRAVVVDEKLTKNGGDWNVTLPDGLSPYSVLIITKGFQAPAAP